MKLWKWQLGRQMGATYFKFPLWYFKIWKWGFDAYILKYKAVTILPKHKDPVDGKHWRLNIGWGVANLVCNEYKGFYYRIGKLTIIFFRPDIIEHSLYVFENTIKLSFGFVKFN